MFKKSMGVPEVRVLVFFLLMHFPDSVDQGLHENSTSQGVWGPPVEHGLARMHVASANYQAINWDKIDFGYQELPKLYQLRYHDQMRSDARRCGRFGVRSGRG